LNDQKSFLCVAVYNLSDAAFLLSCKILRHPVPAIFNSRSRCVKVVQVREGCVLGKGALQRKESWWC
jgi:hypothetical protein